MLNRAWRTVGISSRSPLVGAMFAVDNDGVRKRCVNCPVCNDDCLDMEGRTPCGTKGGRRGDGLLSPDEGAFEDDPGICS